LKYGFDTKGNVCGYDNTLKNNVTNYITTESGVSLPANFTLKDMTNYKYQFVLVQLTPTPDVSVACFSSCPTSNYVDLTYEPGKTFAIYKSTPGNFIEGNLPQF
jgi:hypothetical protein